MAFIRIMDSKSRYRNEVLNLTQIDFNVPVLISKKYIRHYSLCASGHEEDSDTEIE